MKLNQCKVFSDAMVKRNSGLMYATYMILIDAQLVRKQ